MSNPYTIEGPARISFSGGRTSAYMLWHILQAAGGKLPDDVFVTFANTGKERPETLDFIHEIELRWQLNVRWLEYKDRDNVFVEVDYFTASRNGEPFESIIERKQFLPNPVTRYCTTWMKIEPMRRFMRAQGFNHWDSIIGIRADEPRRVSKIRGKKAEAHEDIFMPLADAGVTKRDVMEFWGKQDFDLQLKPYEGNCDLCFLKGRDKLETIIRENPARADWWIAQESRRLSSAPTGACFRYDRPPYSALVQIVHNQPSLFDQCDVDALEDCFCHD